MVAGWLEGPAWRALGWTMLHFLWVGAVLGVGAGLGRLALRRAPAKLRYGFALACLGALAVAPGLLFGRILQTAVVPVTHPTPALLPTPLGQGGTSVSPPPGAAEPKRLAAPGAWSLGRGTPGQLAVWPFYLEAAATQAPWLWMFGTPLTLLSLGLGLAGTNRLRHSSVLLTAGQVRDRCRALARSIGWRREIAVAVSDRILSPILIGIWRPMILFPAAVLTGWTPAQLEMVLLHELAHVRRRDGLVNLVQRLVEAVLFFHPVVWLVSRWVRAERELCCDAWVVRRTGNAVAYAETLASLARPAWGTAFAPGLGATGHPVVRRIRHVLQLDDPVLPAPSAVWVGLAGVGLLAVLLPPLGAELVGALSAAHHLELGAGGLASPVPEVRTSAPGPLPTSEREQRSALVATSTATPGRAPERTLRFPLDRSLGELLLARRTAAMGAGAPRLETWDSWGPAQGTVVVPADRRVRLSISGAAAVQDLALLATLRPDDLDELVFSGWGTADPRIDDTALSHLEGLSSLRVLDLGYLDITDAGLLHLQSLVNLEELSLYGTRVTGAGIVQLKPLKALRKLDLGQGRPDGPAMGDEAAAHLADLDSLEHLSLFGREFTDAGLAQLARLSRLKLLHLPTATYADPALDKFYYTDVGLESLSHIRGLEDLMIGSPAVSDEGLAHLARLTRLRKLTVTAGRVGNAGVAHLAGLRDLEELSLRAPEVTISGVNQLNALRQLRKLNLTFVRQDEGGLDLSALTNLEELTITMRRVREGSTLRADAFRDADMAGLAGLNRLRWLQGIRGISDAGMQHLAGLEEMERLNIGGPGVTDAGLACLARMRKLDHLTVHGQFTDAALRHLERIKSLRFLSVEPLGQVSSAGLERLRQVLPELRLLNRQAAMGFGGT